MQRLNTVGGEIVAKEINSQIIIMRWGPVPRVATIYYQKCSIFNKYFQMYYTAQRKWVVAKLYWAKKMTTYSNVIIMCC